MVSGVPLAVGLVLRAGDGHASAAPGVAQLIGEAEVGAGHGEGLQAVLEGVVIGLLRALNRPVRAAESADLALVVEAVEHFDDGANRHRGVVAVEHIDVQMVGLELRQRVVGVVEDVKVRHALAPAVVMRALGEDDHLVVQTSRLQPLAQRLFAIVVGAVKTVHALGIHIVQKLESRLQARVKIRSLAINRAEGREHLRRGGAEDDMGNGLGNVVDMTILHKYTPPVKDIICEAAHPRRPVYTLARLENDVNPPPAKFLDVPAAEIRPFSLQGDGRTARPPPPSSAFCFRAAGEQPRWRYGKNCRFC